jgi:hypothetical protein
MKRISAIAIILALALSLSACSGVDTDGTSGEISTDPPIDELTENITLTVANVGENSILLCGEDEGTLYTMPASADGASDLKGGMSVEITYTNGIAETYPAQITTPVSIKSLSDANDRVGLFLSALDELMGTDSALNSDTTYLAFDLTGVNNLSDGEKEAFIAVASAKYGLEPLVGTFEELRESGYIDKDNLYFPDGILIEASTKSEHSKSFTFNISKWRSGTGAYYFVDVKAKNKNGEWSYEVTSEAIA